MLNSTPPSIAFEIASLSTISAFVSPEGSLCTTCPGNQRQIFIRQIILLLIFVRQIILLKYKNY